MSIKRIIERPLKFGGIIETCGEVHGPIVARVLRTGGALHHMSISDVSTFWVLNEPIQVIDQDDGDINSVTECPMFRVLAIFAGFPDTVLSDDPHCRTHDGWYRDMSGRLTFPEIRGGELDRAGGTFTSDLTGRQILDQSHHPIPTRIWDAKEAINPWMPVTLVPPTQAWSATNIIAEHDPLRRAQLLYDLERSRAAITGYTHIQ